MAELSQEELNKAFIEACGQAFNGVSQDDALSKAQALVEQGADPLTHDLNHHTAMHNAIPVIAYHWPKSRTLLEGLMEFGLSLNANGEEDLEFGAPMHRLGWCIGQTELKERFDKMAAFVAEAVEHYGADLTLEYEKTATPNSTTMIRHSVLEDFFRQARQNPSVVKTLMAHAPEMTKDQQGRMAQSWAEMILGASGGDRFEQWLEAGVNPEALDIAKAERTGVIASWKRAEKWMEANPELEAATPNLKEALFKTEEQVFQVTADEKEHTYQATALANPANWRNMSALIAACEAQGEPITAEDMLKPRINSASALEIGVRYCCSPREVMEACTQLDIQLGTDELLREDGTRKGLLDAFIELNATNLLFTRENLRGKSKEEFHQLYDALPDVAQQQIRNLHGLSTSLSRQGHAAQAIR